MTTLALLHTGPAVIDPIKQLVSEHIPTARQIHLLDDSVIPEIEAEGHITDAIRERLQLLGRAASLAGADAIMFTCSSISQLAVEVERATDLPTFRIDEAMADEAVRLGSRIAVVATLGTTLDPTCRLIEERAAEAGREVELTRYLCREAFERLSAGDPDGHDGLVAERIAEAAADHDVVVLAQASMARILPRITVDVPVLTSPQLGVSCVAALIDSDNGGAR